MRYLLVVKFASEDFESCLPGTVREVHEEFDVSEVFEALLIHPFYGFYISCHWPYIEELDSFFAGFGDDGFYQLFSYSFAAVGFADYEGLYFSFVAL